MTPVYSNIGRGIERGLVLIRQTGARVVRSYGRELNAYWRLRRRAERAMMRHFKEVSRAEGRQAWKVHFASAKEYFDYESLLGELQIHLGYEAELRELKRTYLVQSTLDTVLYAVAYIWEHQMELAPKIEHRQKPPALYTQYGLDYLQEPLSASPRP